MKLISVDNNVTLKSIRALVRFDHNVIQGDNFFTKKISDKDAKDWQALGFNIVLI